MSIQTDGEAPEARWVEVPSHALSPEALRGVVDEYITREGTEYGEREYTLVEKRESALRLLALGEVIIVYEPESQSTTLKRKESA
jgi:uncharacterized protein YheU (UPF0270 family)